MFGKPAPRRTASLVAPLPLLDRMTRRSSIRGILLFIMLVSLLPLVLLSTWQGIARLQRDRSAGSGQLLESAMMTSASERNVIAGARAILGVLATIPDVRAREQATCGPILQETVRRYPAYSHFSIARPDGTLACASDPSAVGMTMKEPILSKQLQTSGFLVTAPIWGEISNRPILRAVLPLRAADGEFDGVITASIDLAWIERLLSEQHRLDNVAVALVDGAGRPVVSSRQLPWKQLDILPKNADANNDEVFTVAGPDGRDWSYAVAPLHIDTEGGESFHIVYAAAQPFRFGSDWWFAAGYFLLPLLALVLASAAIWYGANRAILRWIAELGTLAGRIGNSGGSDLRRRPSFANAPMEMRDFAADLLRMGNSIAERDHRLRQSVETQTAVARELHHRVRNNLQVMGSFLSLQAARMPAGQARVALDEAQLRVATLAMVNGLLYADGELTTVSVSDLLEPLEELLASHGRCRGEVIVDPDLAPQVVDLDRAVPLSLWVVEAAVCLFERAGGDEDAGTFRIHITSEDDMICFVVTAHGLLPDSGRDSLHRRLVIAIAHQLGGRSRIDDVGPDKGQIVLSMPLDKVMTVEARG
ncbi:two-component sensor histidine kinase [Polymorphobacter multimanifer]|uniref:histidine kinase n=2 Tax=Polymorphobacter multimanifer TaxID=1070431 RepID=A0A841LAC5_9SPHN|nr:two-component sensor histidine kinase [Polymorphobacter multimanifer]